MQREEAEALMACSDCGESFTPATDRGYAAGAEVVVCLSCAIARGGAYDAVDDRWVLAPDVGDLLVREEWLH